MANTIESQAKGAIKETGLDSILNIISGAMKGLKPIINLIDRFTKMITGLLAPILMTITLLLSPMLKALKPIVIIVNKLMRPFLQLAMKTLRAGLDEKKAGDAGAFIKASASATLILLEGLSTILAFAFADMLKNGVTLIVGLIGSFLNAFIPGFNLNFSSINDMLMGGVDSVFLSFADAMITSAAGLASPFVKETEAFTNKAKASFRDAIGQTDTTIADAAKTFDKDVMEEVTKYWEKEKGVVPGLLEAKINGPNGLRVKGVEHISGIIKQAQDRAATIIADAEKKARIESIIN